MKLTTKGRYGLRALVDLAVHSEDGPVTIQSIACRQNISERYLEQLMGSLKKAGLVTSIRGAQGGYLLSREADQISVGDILRALEGDLRAVACAAEDTGQGCENADACVTRYVWKRINDSIRQAVDTIWLSQLAEEGKEYKNRQITDRTCKG